MNYQNQNNNTLIYLRSGLNSSLRDQSNSKSVQQHLNISKIGKSRHFGVLQQLKKRVKKYSKQIQQYKYCQQDQNEMKICQKVYFIIKEDDWDSRFYVQQLPIFKQQNTKIPSKIHQNQQTSTQYYNELNKLTLYFLMSNLKILLIILKGRISSKNSNNTSMIQDISFDHCKVRRITQDSVCSLIRPSTSKIIQQFKSNENASGAVNKYIKEISSQNVQRPSSVNYQNTQPQSLQKSSILQESAQTQITQNQDQEESVKSLQIQISKLWEEFIIPNFHRLLYVECTKQFKKKQIVTILQQEIQTLKDRKSQIQICLRALKARQQCLKTMRDYINQEKNNQDCLNEQVLYKFGELIVHLRILTLNVVESILRWRDQLSQLLFVSCRQKIQNILFLYQNDNYLLIMQNDYKFICESYLKNYFTFQTDYNDPFFLAVQSSNNPFIENNPLKNDVLKRIRASELILLEENIYHKFEQEQNELIMNPLGLFEDEAEDFLKNYIKEIPITLKDNFVSDSKQILEMIQYEQELNWIKVCSKKSKVMQGLCIFYVDKNCFTSRRIIISHISSLRLDNFQKVLDKTIDYIWSNDYCDDIRININYQKDENNEYKINQELQNQLKSIGFKWKQLLSQKDSGIKTTIFGISRPTNKPKTQLKLESQEPVSLKLVSLLPDEHIKSIPDLQTKLYDSSLLINNLLSKVKSTSQKQEQLQQSQSTDKKLIPPGTKEEDIQIDVQMKQLYDTVFDKTESQNLQYLLDQKMKAKITLTKLCYRWLNFHTFQLENYMHSYIRIKIVNKYLFFHQLKAMNTVFNQSV